MKACFLKVLEPPGQTSLIIINIVAFPPPLSSDYIAPSVCSVSSQLLTNCKLNSAYLKGYKSCAEMLEFQWNMLF